MFEQKLPPSKLPFPIENLIEKHQSFSFERGKKKKSETIPLIPYPTWARNTRHVHQLNYAHKQTLRCLLIASPLRKLFGGWASTVDNPLWDWISRQSYIYIYRRKREKRSWPSIQLIVPSMKVCGNKSARVKFLRINHVGHGESEKQDVNSRGRYEVTEP